MFLSIIKFFTIIFGSLILYKKILNLKKIYIIKVLLSILFSIGLAFSMHFLQTSIPVLRIVLMITIVGFFSSILTKIKIDLSITVSIISIGMSYAFNFIAVAISAFLQQAVFSNADINLLAIITMIIDGLLINIPFIFKRTKKGFLFLQKKEAGGIGLLISGIIILFATLMSMRNMDDFVFGALFLGLLICIAGIIFWWRNSITKLYIEKLKEQDVKELEAIVDEKDKQIQKLNERNDFLAGVIHRDNKLIPAMYNAVEVYMSADNANALKDGGNAILNQLNQVMQERAGVILQDQRAHKILPSTKLGLIDSIMQFMYIKATEKDIEFDLRITGNIKYMAENIISESNMETLLADHIENAIIAITGCEYKRVLVTIGVTGEFYELRVQDSGIPFEIKTLANLGVQKATTYEGRGGSGIGYMTSFKIMRETGASLIITELLPKPYSFSKTVTIRFDGKNEYVIQSFRCEEIRVLCDRADMTILPL